MFKINIEAFVLGPVSTNAYLIHNGQNGLIIDPGVNPQQLLARIMELQLKIDAILLTHAHFDHIGGLDEVRRTVAAPVYLHKAEHDWLGDPSLNASLRFGGPITCKPVEHSLKGDELLLIGAWNIKVIHTPGHTPGSVTYCLDEGIFSGDVLFQNSIGRTDLSGGNREILNKTIRSKLLTLPDDTIVYAGHGPKTTIGQERQYNPFI